MNKNKEDMKVIKYQFPESRTGRELNENINHDNNNSNNLTKIFICSKASLSLVIILFVIGVALAIILPLVLKKPRKIDEPTTDLINDTSSPTLIIDLPDYIKENGPLEMQTEYKIKTNVNDLKSIYINQKYYEYIMIDGVLTKNIVDRKTNYHIYVLEKNEAPNEAKYFYNYTYLCAIAISSECVSSKDEFCIPKKLVDFNEQDNSNVRNLKEIDNFENFPIPLCFFNLTDNNVINSITCHKKLNESKINSIVLDLYFFRPPGIKRMDKEKNNISINSKKIGNITFIRETNAGICDIDNPIGSSCTTDMNTTKDSEGNLIQYDENAFTNITNDANNYYIKNKTTYLIDKTSDLSLNPEKFNETLNKLYPKLKDYLKYYEHFSLENYNNLYNISKGIENESQEKRRRLNEKNPTIVNNKNLFYFSHYGGVNLKINLKNNIGYNSENMEASNYLQIDEDKIDLAILTQFTDLDKVIKKLINLSKAGNNLATILYNEIKEKLNNMTDIINVNIPTMNFLLVYKELSDIFDSTFSLNNIKILPSSIIEESDYLINKLDEIYNGIDNGSLKKNLSVLNDYIYQYIRQSHILVRKIANNLEELGKLIKSPKQIISDISNYYMNHTSTSYINTIKQAQNILLYYYENETDLIVPIVKELLEKFENITIESIQKQINLINNLNSKLDNKEFSINNSTEEQYEKLVVNMHNANIYINNIIKLFKKKIENEMDLKNGYFISQYDISSNNETFNRILDEALIIAQKLDDNEYVDKLFDEIMSEFRQKFIDITKDMEKQKEENFVIDEITLKGGYFKLSEQQNISKELKNLGVEIITKITNENNLYLQTVDNVINDFLENNRDYLYQLINEIDNLLSTDSLIDLANSYEDTFNGYFTQLINDIEQNKQLVYEYIDGIYYLMNEDNKVIELLKNYTEKQYVDFNYYKYGTNLIKAFCTSNDIVHEIHCINNSFFTDSINSKIPGKDYNIKYAKFIEKLDISKEFIKSDLHFNLLDEYKNYINQLKIILQTFKNNKMIDKFPDFTNLYFIDDHIKYIDELYNRLNRYISNDIFNNYYIPIIKNYTENETEEIDNIKEYIENKHNIIKKNVMTLGKEKDLCIKFIRKRTFTCRNGDIYDFYPSEDECFNSVGSNNLNDMKKISFNNDKIFEEKFNQFFSTLKNKIDLYNNLIDKLKQNITSIESEILNKNITNNYLDFIEDKVNNLLSEKYSINLIKGSYDYYKNLLDERIENILNNASNQWISSFDNLRTNVNNNLNNFSHSINEFGVMALIYEAVISQNLTKTFYNSIINHQKSEFNYTISYYYNSLLQNITSVYQYILNQIPTNKVGLNNITNLRKKEVEDKFHKIFEMVQESKLDSLSISKQIYVLQVSSSNFFNSDSVLSRINKETSNLLKNKGNIIYKLKNGKKNDEYSLACRFYLENSLNGLHIEEYYKPVNERNSLFIDFNRNNFIELLSNNWIFDQDDLINKINICISKSYLEIKNDISIKKENYSELLENEIIKYKYSKENISSKINEQYNLHIKKIDEEIKNNSTKYINDILNLIKSYLINEEERLLNTAVSYTNDFSAINNTIKKYKEEIIDKLINIIQKIVDDFHEKLKKKSYDEIIEPGLNKYLEKSEEYISQTKPYMFLNSSYNIGEIINEIVKGYVEDYKNFTKNELNIKHNETIQKLKNDLGIDEIKRLIYNEINDEYSKLLGILNSITKNIKSPIIGYTDYDLNDNIKNEINIKIEENLEKINELIINRITYNDNIKLIGWENLALCYDKIDTEIFLTIDSNFKTFINDKISNEKTNLNKLIKNALRNNFNNIISNFVSTFGNDFFERILNYNENFKINPLYQNLKYSLVISLNYYQMLYQLTRNINSLTSDLKIKLYKFNDLDKITEKENKIILNILNDKVDEFIEITKQHILSDYKSYIISDSSINLEFNNEIQKFIKNNLEDVSSDLEKDYTNLLNEKFKIKINNSFTRILNNLTSDMLRTINNMKVSIKSLFDDLFSLEIDKILNQTNTQMNITLNSIEEYNNFFNTFILPEQLVEYTLNYGNNIIKPSYERLETLINKETKISTFNNIEIKASEFKDSYKNDELIKNIKNVLSLFNNNYNNIINSIDSYGINNYPDVLQNEINRIDKRARRRLTGDQTEKDEEEEYKEKVADKSLDENFQKLLKVSNNSKIFIQTYENFDKFIETIEKSKKKLNLSYKQAQQAIIDAFQDEEDVYQELNDKLNNLYNISLNYYNEINNNFISLRNHTESSLNEIDDLLNECANITYKTFADKYEEISKEAESFDNNINDIEKEIPLIASFSSSQNNEYLTEATITALIKKAQFKFSLIFDQEEEGKVKKPKVIAVVSNEIIPQKMKFKISNSFGECGQDYQIVDVNFNKVNYTNVLYFDTQSTLINVKTITDFDEYIYSIARYKILNSEKNQCVGSEGISLCVVNDCENSEIEIVEAPRNKEVPKIYEVESQVLID